MAFWPELSSIATAKELKIMSTRKRPATRMKKPAEETKKPRSEVIQVDPLPTMPGPLAWVVHRGNQRLPVIHRDPEDYLLEPRAAHLWNERLKTAIRITLEDSKIWHFGPMSVMAELPLQDKPWECKHKTLAIMSMRICLGEYWLNELQVMPLEKTFPTELMKITTSTEQNPSSEALRPCTL